MTQSPTYRRFRLRRFASRGARTFAALFTLGYAGIEGVVFFFDAADGFKVPALGGWLVITLVAALTAGVVAQRRLRSRRVDLGPEASVTVIVGDFVENLELFPTASCVIGVNDQFSVDDLVDTSLHACFLERFASSSDLAARQLELDEHLAKLGLLPTGSVGTTERSARARHPMGTVAAQPFATPGRGARYAFMLVNSRHSGLGYVAGDEDVRVGAVWDFHEAHDHVSDEVVFSLVGTGESRRLGKIQSAVEIVDEYFGRRERPGRARVRRLVISIHPHTVTRGEVDLEAVYRYLDARAAVHRAMSSPAKVI